MSVLKRSLLRGALMLLLPLGAASASEPICSASEDSSFARANEESGSAQASYICHASFCETDQDCVNACPSAPSAACVDYTCQYSTSGGGGGGGGPFCPASFCDDDSQCTCKGAQGYCGTDWTCHY
ncbi:hypothetical protein JRI60_51035 [Archangium violaceum]|uniref:hypothetical protein n=1 Tax=Archangium violaceum TaxID=83451 RepID=UPI0019515BBC|nr:hypothetical protein [Archangium violaceum]QRN97193.1 hypothetical protein JRI60_51035 [Archangium violaceum]